MNRKGYTEHKGKVVEAHGQFVHTMAIALNPHSQYKEGILRCVTKRSGDVARKGNLDRSKLFHVEGTTLENFTITKQLAIAGEQELITNMSEKGLWDFIGLEDPDIWIDPKTDLIHVYFTIPFIQPEKVDFGAAINLGHAVGKDLDSLEMTEPTLRSMYMGGDGEGAKEISVAPVNRQGVRLNLIESSDDRGSGHKYSTIRVAIAEDMGQPWQYAKTAFHPAEANTPWIGGHASPGPLFPRSFVDVGIHKLLGVINGRSMDQVHGDTIEYGMFSVGLFIYNYEEGNIEWVSPYPFIQDSQARNITFASQFVETGHGHGVLYAHVDDSFVRAYSLDAEVMRSIIP